MAIINEVEWSPQGNKTISKQSSMSITWQQEMCSRQRQGVFAQRRRVPANGLVKITIIKYNKHI
ncbi:MAG: hypothetical protein LBS55_06195 [Prevotellaceae bacterium]|nr:hypothetical protein [Prevotellaceae bacterium]